MKEFELNGCIVVPDEMSFDEFTDVFLELIESKDWEYGGGMHELDDKGNVITHGVVA